MLNYFTPTSPPGISHKATDLLGAIGFQHPPNRPSRFPCSLCTIRPSLPPRAGCPSLHSMSFPAGPAHRYFSPCSLPRVQISLDAPSSQAWIRLSATSTHRDEAYAMSLGAHLCGPPRGRAKCPQQHGPRQNHKTKRKKGAQENTQAKKKCARNSARKYVLFSHNGSASISAMR